MTSVSIRNHLTREIAEELELFRFAARGDGQIKVLDRDLNALHEALLAPKYNFGAPNIAVSQLRNDGSLELKHDHQTDGRGIDVDRGRKVLEYIQRVWRRPVTLHTVDQGGAALVLAAS
ncbi:MAG: hypothetical protein WDM77_12630 [Steroidobacteraceae bacterium]